MDSRCSQRKHHLTRKSGNKSQCIRCAHEVCSGCRSRSASSKTQSHQQNPALSHVFKYGLGVEKIKTLKPEKEDIIVKEKTNFSANRALSRGYQQACSQRHGQRSVQGHVCMLDFDSFEDRREILTQRFRNASTRIRRAFTPPPCRGSVLSESRCSNDSGIQNEDHLFT